MRSAEEAAAHMAGRASGCTAAKAATPAARERPPRANALAETADARTAEARALCVRVFWWVGAEVSAGLDTTSYAPGREGAGRRGADGAAGSVHKHDGLGLDESARGGVEEQ